MRKIVKVAAATVAAVGTVAGSSLLFAPAGHAYSDVAARPGVRTYGHGSYTAYGVSVSFISRYDAGRALVFHSITLTDLNCDSNVATVTLRGDYRGRPVSFNQYYLTRSCNSYAKKSVAVSTRLADHIYMNLGNGGFSNGKFYTKRLSNLKLYSFYK